MDLDSPADENKGSSFAKRAFDLIASLAGLLLLWPLLLAVSAAILAFDGRPVLFRHRRVGRKGLPFTLLKFRTMRVDPAAGAGAFDRKSASRITPLGRFLRKTKIDELPQLWNVLKGDMSLVGPRPEVERWVAAYPERWHRVLAVRPGITDPASILYRDEEKILAAAEDWDRTYREVILPHKLDLYEKYVQNRSFRGDIGIIMKTLWAVARPPRTAPPADDGSGNPGGMAR
jgi:lipopolysaccharide/colanic/teichoic acid biosynthesis glycosyltransferase